MAAKEKKMLVVRFVDGREVEIFASGRDANLVEAIENYVKLVESLNETGFELQEFVNIMNLVGEIRGGYIVLPDEGEPYNDMLWAWNPEKGFQGRWRRPREGARPRGRAPKTEGIKAFREAAQ